MLARELRIGPRSPLVLWAFVMPVMMTLLIRGVFGGLFAPEPRLGIRAVFRQGGAGPRSSAGG